MADDDRSLVSSVPEMRALVIPRFHEDRPNPVHAFLATYASNNSRDAAIGSLRRVLHVLNKPPERWETAEWWALTPAHGIAIRARLAQQYGPGTARLTLTMLRGLLRQCFVLGYMNGDAFQRVTSWPKVRGVTLPPGRMLAKEEIAALRAACARGSAFWGAMDAAILACGLGAGLRREEIAKLDGSALTADSKFLELLGKGQKMRRVDLEPGVAATIEVWLAQRDRFPFKTPAMFVRERAGKAIDERISKWTVWQRLRELGERAKVRSFTPHDLRRTFCSTLLDHADLVTVRDIMGHADVRTTARYDRRPGKARAAAVAHLGSFWGPVSPASLKKT